VWGALKEKEQAITQDKSLSKRIPRGGQVEGKKKQYDLPVVKIREGRKRAWHFKNTATKMD